MAKKNNGGGSGSNGDSGAAPADADSLAPVETNAAVIPPDQQATPGEQTEVGATLVDRLNRMSMDELKAAQRDAAARVAELRGQLAASILREREIEHERCLRYQAEAKARGDKSAVVTIDDARFKVKKRNGSDLLQLVDASVPAAHPG